MIIFCLQYYSYAEIKSNTAAQSETITKIHTGRNLKKISITTPEKVVEKEIKIDYRPKNLNLNHYLSLAIKYRSDLKSDRETLKTVPFDKLNASIKKKWTSIVTEIKTKNNILNITLSKRKKLESELYMAFQKRNILRGQYKNNEIHLIELKQAQRKLYDVREKFLNTEKNVDEAWYNLCITCGMRADQLKKPSIATLNESQRTYVGAQKAYLNAEIGISDNTARLDSAIGISRY